MKNKFPQRYFSPGRELFANNSNRNVIIDFFLLKITYTLSSPLFFVFVNIGFSWVFLVMAFV